MRRRNQFLPFAFAATLLGGCLGSFGTPGGSPDPAPQPAPTTGGNGAQTGGGDTTTPPTNGGTMGGGGAGGSGGGGSGGSGGSGGGMMPPAAQGTLAVALDKATDNIRLNETKTYAITLTPAGGFTGGVTLSLDNPPAGVTAKFTPATVNVTGTAPVTASVDITAVSDTAKPATALPLAVKAVSGTISASANLAVTIPAELLITIAKGVNIGSAAAPNATAFGGVNAISVHYVTGLKITWMNLDGINHEVHAQGTANTAGIAHEGGPLMANAANAYSQTINGPTTIKSNDTHCHIHPTMIGPTINVLP